MAVSSTWNDIMSMSLTMEMHHLHMHDSHWVMQGQGDLETTVIAVYFWKLLISSKLLWNKQYCVI